MCVSLCSMSVSYHMAKVSPRLMPPSAALIGMRSRTTHSSQVTGSTEVSQKASRRACERIVAGTGALAHRPLVPARV